MEASTSPWKLGLSTGQLFPAPLPGGSEQEPPCGGGAGAGVGVVPGLGAGPLGGAGAGAGGWVAGGAVGIGTGTTTTGIGEGAGLLVGPFGSSSTIVLHAVASTTATT